MAVPYVLNKGLKPKMLTGMQKHIERQADAYQNRDIIRERTHMNVWFKKPQAGYRDEMNRLLADGVYHANSKGDRVNVLDGMVLDVNPRYFSGRGDYREAVRFFEEAYSFAAREAGGEQFVISAVMHADELSYAASVETGAQMFHYHLHVVYAPVVFREAGSPGSKGKEGWFLSHTAKWPVSRKEKDGVIVCESAYADLQHRFFEHMTRAGFTGLDQPAKKNDHALLTGIRYKIERESKLLDSLRQQTRTKPLRADREAARPPEGLTDHELMKWMLANRKSKLDTIGEIPKPKPQDR